MELSLSILAIGSELLDGRVVDTNSNFVAGRLESLGVPLRHVLSCDDIESEIIRCLEFLLGQSLVVLVSGGLGPTTDDLTRESVSTLIGSPLEERLEIIGWLRELYEKRRRAFDPSNNKQALFPRGAIILSNPVGTAAGFRVEDPASGGTIICLPGVPRELRPMFEQEVEAYLLSSSLYRGTVRQKRVLRVFGVPEAKLNSVIGTCDLPKEIVVSYRASFPEVQILLKAPTSFSKLDNVTSEVTRAIGEDCVFSTELDLSLEQSLHQLLIGGGLTIATAESCTGGLIASALTSQPGSSAYYLGGISAYSNAVKVNSLGVESALLTEFGAVSAPVAAKMAEGVRLRIGADLGLSITGIAGPDGGSAEKPVGLFFIGLADKDGASAYRFFVGLTRENIRRFATAAALDLVRRRLQGWPLLGNH